MQMALYLCASPSTAAEQAFNRGLAAALRSAGYTVFLPQEIDQTQDQRTIFNLNVQELKACSMSASGARKSKTMKSRHLPYNSG